MRELQQVKFTTITNITPHPHPELGDISVLQTEDRAYCIHDFLLRRDSKELINKKVKIVADIEWKILRILSWEMEDKKKFLYKHSDEVLRLYQEQCMVNLCVAFNMVDDNPHMRRVYQWADKLQNHDWFHDMEQTIPPFWKEKWGIPVREHEGERYETPDYTFDEIETIARWWHIYYAGHQTDMKNPFNENDEREFDPVVRWFYNEYLRFWKWLSLREAKGKGRDLYTFAQEVAKVRESFRYS